MLSKALRLNRSSDIKQILRVGRTMRGKFLRLKYAKNKYRAHRWAFVISNKVDKRATKRNRIRRQLHSIIWLNKDKYIHSAHADVVIMASPAIVGKTYPEIQLEIETLLVLARLMERPVQKNGR